MHLKSGNFLINNYQQETRVVPPVRVKVLLGSCHLVTGKGGTTIGIDKFPRDLKSEVETRPRVRESTGTGGHTQRLGLRWLEFR